MKDGKGKILLPDFYKDVKLLSEKERDAVNSLPTTDEWWKAQSGADALFGEEGFTSTERASSRPTLDVNGLICGFTGEGSKTVLPAKAKAKISMRLVPDQSADKIHKSLYKYLEGNIPDPSIKCEVKLHHSARPVIVDLDYKPVRAAEKALEEVWNKKPLFWRAGGSIALIGQFQEMLDVDVLMMGFFMHDDNIHAPNERFHVPNFYRGIEAYIHFFYELGDL
jgi:acetylornithine deacetylase/succinyl-diaminopimelate desuccinylase-like protein